MGNAFYWPWGEGEVVKRDDLHTPPERMKLFSGIGAAVVIGASFIAPSPTEANNGWIAGQNAILSISNV